MTARVIEASYRNATAKGIVLSEVRLVVIRPLRGLCFKDVPALDRYVNK
jgi:hypothetical protein